MLRKLIASLLSLTFSASLFIPVYAETETDNTLIHFADNNVYRSRTKQVNIEEVIECGSSKYGSYNITVYISGVLTLDNSGNIIDHDLSYSYNCRYPLKTYVTVSDFQTYLSIGFAFFVTYPDGTETLVTRTVRV